MRKNYRKITVVLIILMLLGGFGIKVKAAFNEKFDYQGKLTDPNNIPVSDGNYDMVFKLYDAAGGGTLIWTESWTNAALFTDSSTTFTNNGCAAGVDKMAYSTDANEGTLVAGQYLWNTTKKESAVIESVSAGGAGGYICFYDPFSTWASNDIITNRIYVKNGLFSVMLGTITSLSSVNFNQTLYLGVIVGADSEMKPRKVLGAVPAAFEAKRLGGYTWATPDAIGSGTPNTGAFTTLTTTVAIGAGYGGTGQSSYATGDMLYASGPTTLTQRNIGSTGQVLTVSGGVPNWTTATYPATIAAGSILAANVLDTLSAVTATSGAKYLKNVDGTISWATELGTYVGMTDITTYTADLDYGGYSGYPAGDAICGDDHPGSHLCQTAEILYTISTTDFSSTFPASDQAWISNGPGKYSGVGVVPVNDCNGFTHGVAGSYLGNFWAFNNTTGGVGGCGGCFDQRPLACCK